MSWDQILMDEGEIRLESWQTKVKRPRTIEFNDGPKEQKPFNAALRAWLAAYRSNPILPGSWRRHLDHVKREAGFGTPTEKEPHLKPWVPDVMRHTAISFFFRLTGSFGAAAELFGNSEQKIRQHYKARVSSLDTRKFYDLRPTKGSRR